MSHRRPRAVPPRRRTRPTQRPLVEPLEARSLLALTITVTTAADETDLNDGTMSFREAIEVANGQVPLASLGADRSLVTGTPAPVSPAAPPVPNTIKFNVSGADAAHPIQVTGTPLPAITAPVIIDGYSQPGSSASPPDKTEVVLNVPAIRIDGVALGSGPGGQGYDGLDVNAPDCQVEGLIVTGFSGVGIAVANPAAPGAWPAQGNWVWGNILGALPDAVNGRDFIADPSARLGNLGGGFRITASNNRIGGNTPGLPNVIANNGYDAAGSPNNATPGAGTGIDIETATGTGNLIQGNAILGNAAQGVYVASSNNTIGEALKGGGNSIGGNGGAGVEITGGITVQGNNVVGNFIGTELGTVDGKITRGLIADSNGAEGVLILNSPKNTIGGYSTAARNIIGTNALDGVAITGDLATGNRLLNNWIGFNIVNGLEALLPNRNGVYITAPGNLVGDDTGGSGNTIDNNRNDGILLSGAGASGNTIQGNVVGLNPDGASAFGNAFDGIHLDNAPNNVIGGLDVNARNTVSSNNNGIVLVGPAPGGAANTATGNYIEGNFIGTAVDGLTDLGNAVDGVILDNAPQNYVGFDAAGAGNVISGNNRGLVITGPASRDNRVQGNFIGTDLAGKAVIHNEIDGVLITAGASSNTVGGLTPGAGNTITHNVGAGVNLDDGDFNAVLGNSIDANTGNLIDPAIGHGIVLNAANNANNGQPAPQLTFAAPNGNLTNVQGTLTAAPNTVYTVQFFASATKDPSGFGQGQTFSGSFPVTTDGSGHAAIDLNLPSSVPAGQFVTATATDPQGNTSAFSNAIPAVPITLQLGSATLSVGEADGQATVTVTCNVGQGGNALQGQVAVNYAVGGGSAVAGTDYTAVSGTLFFNPGDPLTKTFTVPILDPHKVGGSVTANVTLSQPTAGATLGAPATAVLTILDNEIATIHLGAAAATFSEGAGTATFTVTRDSTSGSSTVSYATSDGTAVAGVNYVKTVGSLTFAPGEASKTINVPLLDDGHVTGPLHFTLTLSNPGNGVLGAPATAQVTETNADAAGALEFTAVTMPTPPGAKVAAVTVIRAGGKSGTVTVNYAAAGGTARPGVDYTPVAGTLTFGPGETVKVIAVPLLNTGTPGPVVTFAVGLGGPGGGATLGSPAYTTVKVIHPTGAAGGGGSGDLVPPTVVGFQPVAGASGVNALLFTFSEPMDPARASDVASYGYFATAPGPDGVYGTYDDFADPMVAAWYNPANLSAVVVLGAPLPFGAVGQIVVSANANASLGRGLADTSGNLLDGTGTGHAPGTPYAIRFAEGNVLSYIDPVGNAVVLAVAGPGLMTLRLGLNDAAQQLGLVGTVPGLSTLVGQVRAPRRGVGGTTTIPSIVGAAGVRVLLRNPPFILGGGISAMAVDALSVSGNLKARRGLTR